MPRPFRETHVSTAPVLLEEGSGLLGATTSGIGTTARSRDGVDDDNG
jgi:hypothetical protein